MMGSDAVFLGTWVAVLALAWASMLLRYVARGLILKTLRLDDALATVALIVGTGSIVCAILGFLVYGLIDGNKLLYIFELLYIVSTLLIKLSFCLTLLPLLRSTQYRRVLMATAALPTIFSAALFIWSAVQAARGVGETGWDPALVIATYLHAGVLIATDLSLAALSITIVSKLQMKCTQKVSVLLLLLVGSSPFIATILRIVYTSSLYDFTAPLHRLKLFATFTLAEMCACIITSAAATLRPVFARVRRVSTGRSYTRGAEQHTHAVVSNRVPGESGTYELDAHYELSSLRSENSKIHITRTFRVDSRVALGVESTDGSADGV